MLEDNVTLGTWLEQLVNVTLGTWWEQLVEALR